MPDYKKMYLALFRATEQAINTLIEAQRACEELYVSEPETELRVVPLPVAQRRKTNQQLAERVRLHKMV